MTTQLVKYSAARKALAAAHRVDEVKTHPRQGGREQAYAKQAQDSDLVDMATEIRLRAEIAFLCDAGHSSQCRSQDNLVSKRVWP
jgi:hypothetical protein